MRTKLSSRRTKFWVLGGPPFPLGRCRSAATPVLDHCEGSLQEGGPGAGLRRCQKPPGRGPVAWAGSAAAPQRIRRADRRNFKSQCKERARVLHARHSATSCHWCGTVSSDLTDRWPLKPAIFLSERPRRRVLAIVRSLHTPTHHQQHRQRALHRASVSGSICRSSGLLQCSHGGFNMYKANFEGPSRFRS